MRIEFRERWADRWVRDLVRAPFDLRPCCTLETYSDYYTLYLLDCYCKDSHSDWYWPMDSYCCNRFAKDYYCCWSDLGWAAKVGCTDPDWSAVGYCCCCSYSSMDIAIGYGTPDRTRLLRKRKESNLMFLGLGKTVCMTTIGRWNRSSELTGRIEIWIGACRWVEIRSLLNGIRPRLSIGIVQVRLRLLLLRIIYFNRNIRRWS